MNGSLKKTARCYQGGINLVDMGAAALESVLRVLIARRNGPVGCRGTTRALIRTDMQALRAARAGGVA
jgi:hypothetical protein